MDAITRARQLARFIRGIDGFLTTVVRPAVHGHIGASLADAVLQAGLNYRTVVLPRVERLKRQWPRSRYLPGFRRDLSLIGVHRILNWNHDEKPRRLVDLVRLLTAENIESEGDLRMWLSETRHHDVLLTVRGIGPKTVDYLSRLVGGATVAVDRHITRFVAQVCPHCTSYNGVQEVVCYAADILGVERSNLDYAIWRYMARGTDRLNAA